MCGDSDLFTTLVGLFLEDSAEKMVALRDAIEREDSSAVMAHAHALKGMAGNFAAHPTHRVARRLERFLTQPFHATEQFTSAPGRRVSLEEAIEGCAQILSGAFNDRPERDLYMIGAIDEAGRARE